MSWRETAVGVIVVLLLSAAFDSLLNGGYIKRAAVQWATDNLSFH